MIKNLRDLSKADSMDYFENEAALITGAEKLVKKCEEPELLNLYTDFGWQSELGLNLEKQNVTPETRSAVFQIIKPFMAEAYKKNGGGKAKDFFAD